MDHYIERLELLTERYLLGTITPEEQAELDFWRSQSAENESRFQKRISEGFVIEGLSILREAQQAMREDLAASQNDTIVKPLRPKRFYIPAAAAAILIVATGLVYYLFRTTKPYQPAPGKASIASALIPGGNKAVLTLDNGQQIVLDSAADGMLAEQGGAVVQKLQSGQLSYVIRPATSGTLMYNTIATPAGGQYRVTLPDGSKVWLNDKSMLRYPTSFSGKERLVELSGEAYLEVKKNPLLPFKVKAGNTIVTVLGTHFDVNAYTDESGVKTTLLEGLVSVSSQGKDIIIHPGQQANVQGSNINVGYADTSAVTAWKDGYFEFTDADINVVMRQIGRWYAADIRFEGKAMQQTVSGRISRNNLLNDVLTFLEASGYHFKIDGKTIVVLP